MNEIDEEIGMLLRAKLRAESVAKGFLTDPLSRSAAQRTGCAGKEAFPTHSAAERVARLQSKRHRGRFLAYRCRYCNQFHTGSSSVKETKETKDER